MHTYLRAIGFRECKNRQQLEDIYRHTLNTPNRKIMTTISVDTSLLQFEKDFGKNFGLSLVGEYDIKGSLSIEHYFPYLKGDRFMQFENITIQKQTDKESYAGVCEDYHLGMTIIFYVINIADYAKSKWLNYSNRQITKVKFSALSVAGTICSACIIPSTRLPLNQRDGTAETSCSMQRETVIPTRWNN